MNTLKTIAARLQAADSTVRLYTYDGSRSGSLVDAARRQLDGKATHYYAPSTIRYFGARLLHLETLCHGLILGTIESVKPNPETTLYRAVFFDVFGSVVYRTEKQTDGFTGLPTLRAARKDYQHALMDIDWVGHTVKAIGKHAQQMRNEASALMQTIEAD